MTIVEDARGVTGGVDTHLDVHVVAALDPVGALLGTAAFATTPKGYESLLGWLESFGPVVKVGVEGTGSYGAGLSKFLARAGIRVIEVNRPNREERRRSGKSDPSMPLRPPDRRSVARPRALPSPKTVPSRPSERSSSPSARRARPGPARSSRCENCS